MQLAGISANSRVVELVLQCVPLVQTWTLQYICKDAREDEHFFSLFQFVLYVLSYTLMYMLLSMLLLIISMLLCILTIIQV